MLKMFAFGGALTHLAAGISPAITATTQSQPINWITVGMYTLGPGLVDLAVAVLTTLLSRPPEVLAPTRIESRA